ncbi:hypothetical protein AAL_01034 [Moelleriella libera RCEF 2490]|uniref:Uncharacterized protein n=1 Tax=Moelleriella libera RCEF 2490 TaxID=1081109 RepID=A0A166VEG0_9HYPO|nr:hypothetical protein AAL_01034 [Moelleriella libera RCEF 2490]
MSRVTAPLSKIARAALSSSPTSGVGVVGVGARAGTPIMDSSAHSAGAALMPKYADLLRNRRINEHSDSSRGLATNHRPTPQPSIANRAKPLMQTFHSSAAAAAMQTSTQHIDATVFPPMTFLAGPSNPDDGPRVPLLPDNYGVAHGPIVIESAVMPEVTIVAANPDNVIPGAPKAEVKGFGLDGIELKFLYEENSRPVQEDDRSNGMIRDIWKGMVEDFLGGAPRKAF